MTPVGLPRPLPFVPCGDLVDAPHVVVDGAAGPSTVLSLSHWPMSPTPSELARDLSAEIAFAYLDSPRWWSHDAVAATNDHVDQDGLVSLYALTEPGHARRHERALVEIARVGDFAVVLDDDVAQLSFALAVLGDPARSPLVEAPRPEHAGRAVPAGDVWSRVCYPELLSLLPDLLEQPERYAAIGAEERIALERSRGVLARGLAAVLELPGIGLAVVSVDDSVVDVPGSRFCRAVAGPLHPAVIHGATAAPRILVAHGHRYRYYDRYETWVRFTSRELPLRRDLGVLARHLTELEGSATSWRADPPGSLEPVLSHPRDEESSLDLDRVVEALADHLASAPIAWDPFAVDGPLTGVPLSRPGRRARVRRGAGAPDASPGGSGVSGRAGSKGGTNGRGRSRS